MKDTRRMILSAADLISEGKENSEYDRAVIELVGQTLGIGLDVGTRQAIHLMLIALSENHS